MITNTQHRLHIRHFLLPNLVSGTQLHYKLTPPFQTLMMKPTFREAN